MNGQRVTLRQRRDLGQIIEGAFNLYLQNAGPLFRIAAVVIPLGIASAVVQTGVDGTGTFLVVALGLALLQAAVSLLAWTALIAALAEIDAGRAPEFSRAYDVAFARFWTLVGAGLRAAFHVLLFYITIIGIPWAIQRGVRWLFIHQAVILDGTSARASLSYSADAVSGMWWRTLGIAVVIAIIGAVPSTIITGIFALAPPLISGTLGALVNAALLPFYAIAMTLLYLDLQTRKESDVIISPA
jgi:hypothetical protein